MQARAAASFEKATAADPSNASFWTNLGNARRELGDLDRAEQAYRRALEIDATYPDAANGLGVVMVQRKRFGRRDLPLSAGRRPRSALVRGAVESRDCVSGERRPREGGGRVSAGAGDGAGRCTRAQRCRAVAQRPPVVARSPPPTRRSFYGIPRFVGHPRLQASARESSKAITLQWLSDSRRVLRARRDWVRVVRPRRPCVYFDKW